MKTKLQRKPVKLFGSGTNVGRVAKAAKRVSIFESVPYRAKEIEDPGTVLRRFARLNLAGVEDVAKYTNQNGFSWSKVFKNPRKASNTLQSIVQGLFGTGDTNIGGLQLNTLEFDGQTFDFDCVMLWCSSDNKQLEQFAEMVKQWVPNSLVQVFNSEHTNNRAAETLAKELVAQAKQTKQRVIFISNTMASRSFSVSEIEASIFMFDRNNLGAVEQKASRCYTNGNLMNGQRKEFAWVISLSTDANRADSLTEMTLTEAQRMNHDDTDFARALKGVLNTLNIFSDRYGIGTLMQNPDLDEVMYELQDAEKLVKVANACSSFAKMDPEDLIKMLSGVEKAEGCAPQVARLLERVKAMVVLEAGVTKEKLVNEARKEQQALARKIAKLNESAMTVSYYTSTNPATYREALESFDSVASSQFESDFGITAGDTLALLDAGVLAGELLDLVVYSVQNSSRSLEW